MEFVTEVVNWKRLQLEGLCIFFDRLLFDYIFVVYNIINDYFPQDFIIYKMLYYILDRVGYSNFT